MALGAAESDEDAFRPAHPRAAALFPGNLDTEPPCVSKRFFRTRCNARLSAPNRDREGADVFNVARHGWFTVKSLVIVKSLVESAGIIDGNAAVPDGNRTVGESGRFRIMRDHENGLAAVVINRA